MIKRHNTSARMSQAVEYPSGTSIIVLSGQLSADRTLDFDGQTLNLLNKLDEMMAELGTDKSKIISAMIWLKDIKNRHKFNGHWDVWVPEGAAPARACVQSELAEPTDLVEIQLTVYK